MKSFRQYIQEVVTDAPRKNIYHKIMHRLADSHGYELHNKKDHPTHGSGINDTTQTVTYKRVDKKNQKEKSMPNKPSKELIECILQVVNEKKSSVGDAGSIVGLGGAGYSPGLGSDGLNAFVPKPVPNFKVKSGYKKVGLGWLTTEKDFANITARIARAGIKPDDPSDPRSVLKALNQVKQDDETKFANNLARELGTSIDRTPDVISDIKQAIIQYDKMKAEFSRGIEKIADKIHAINKGVIEKIWKNPDKFNKSNASKYVAWSQDETGEHETARSALPGHKNRPGLLPWELDPDKQSPVNPRLRPFHFGGKEIPAKGGFDFTVPDEPDPQGAQAPTGKDARIATVKRLQQEKQGVYTPQTNNKVAKKLIKDVMKIHPDNGVPLAVMQKDSKAYKTILDNLDPEIKLPKKFSIVVYPEGGNDDYGQERASQRGRSGNWGLRNVSPGDPRIPWQDFPRPGDPVGPDVVRRPGTGTRITWNNRTKKFTQIWWNMGNPGGPSVPFDTSGKGVRPVIPGGGGGGAAGGFGRIFGRLGGGILTILTMTKPAGEPQEWIPSSYEPTEPRKLNPIERATDYDPDHR